MCANLCMKYRWQRCTDKELYLALHKVFLRIIFLIGQKYDKKKTEFILKVYKDCTLLSIFRAKSKSVFFFSASFVTSDIFDKGIFAEILGGVLIVVFHKYFNSLFFCCLFFSLLFLCLSLFPLKVHDIYFHLTLL